MRINKFIALSTGVSRRYADKLIQNNVVRVNGTLANLGSIVDEKKDKVEVNNKLIKQVSGNKFIIIKFNKPTGYVVSKNGQGNKTIYDLLPSQYSNLKPVGRLDKNSTGILLLTDDGDLIQKLTHPSNKKNKVYIVGLDKPLNKEGFNHISKYGVNLEDGLSKLKLIQINNSDYLNWKIIMTEGRNRQIRRTFDFLNYKVIKLHRISFDSYSLGSLKPGQIEIL